jgi:hypothetical protein
MHGPVFAQSLVLSAYGLLPRCRHMQTGVLIKGQLAQLTIPKGRHLLRATRPQVALGHLSVCGPVWPSPPPGREEPWLPGLQIVCTVHAAFELCWVLTPGRIKECRTFTCPKRLIRKLFKHSPALPQ